MRCDCPLTCQPDAINTKADVPPDKGHVTASQSPTISNNAIMHPTTTLRSPFSTRGCTSTLLLRRAPSAGLRLGARRVPSACPCLRPVASSGARPGVAASAPSPRNFARTGGDATGSRSVACDAVDVPSAAVSMVPSAVSAVLSAFRLPDAVIINNVPKTWEFSAFWIIALSWLLVRPVVFGTYCALRSVRDKQWRGWDFLKQQYQTSTFKSMETPLRLIVIPMTISYGISQVLNYAYTYKTMKMSVLAKSVGIYAKANNFLYLVWGGLSVVYLKAKFIPQMVGRSIKGRRLIPVVDKLFTIGILLFLAAAGLKLAGLEREAFGLAGTASVAIALSVQNILQQMVASIVLCNPESPFSIGDRIRVLGVEGNVSEIGWFTTKLVASDTMPVQISNIDVQKARIENITLMRKRHMKEDFVLVPPNAEAAFAAVEEIREMLEKSPVVSPTLTKRCHVFGFKNNGVSVILECFFDAPGYDPRCRDIELDGHHEIMRQAVRIIHKHNCKLGAQMLIADDNV